MKMSPEEKAKKDEEMRSKGYIKDYVFCDGELVESWIAPKDRPINTPRVFDKDGREIRTNFSIKR